jgi:hypothetical protein
MHGKMQEYSPEPNANLGLLGWVDTENEIREWRSMISSVNKFCHWLRAELGETTRGIHGYPGKADHDGHYRVQCLELTC